MTDVVVGPLIDGKQVSSASDASIEMISPATGRRFATIPAGCEADVNRAVASALAAYEDGRWAELAPSERKKVLHRFADLIVAQASSLDAMDAAEMGKPVSTQFCNAAAAAGLVRFYAEAVDKVFGDVYSSDSSSFVAQRRVPRGVVAAIVPWNFPTYVVVLKIAPALAAGNSVVLKPSELASSSAMKLAQLGLQAGLPAGVLNVVPGGGGTVGKALGLHKHVHMVTFTGSTAVGKRMMEYAGQSNMKVVLAECGGKSPQILFGDGVDLDQASQQIAQFLVTNQGQICSVGSRLLVQRSIEATVVEKISEHVRRIEIGDPLNPRTTFGPLASARQFERVLQYIEMAPREGARLVSGGRRVMEASGGFFVEPTIFTHVAPMSRIAQDEIFGPVLSVIPFDDEADAIRIANDSMYGLAAYVWTARLSTGMRMVRAIRSSVLVNAVAPRGEGAGHAMSSEPYGQSGVGVEGGIAGMESYLRRQLVWINHG